MIVIAKTAAAPAVAVTDRRDVQMKGGANLKFSLAGAFMQEPPRIF